MSVGASETACLRGSLCTSEAGSTTNRDRLYQGVVDDLDTLVRAVGLNVFLAEMAAVVPWGKLEALIEPHYPRLGPQGGRRPFPLSTMLRIYCLQQWYNLSDPGAEEALYDIQSMRAFAGLELGRDAIPDETTILNFRHLLERHEVTKAIFASVAEHLAARGELLRGGTIVDATLIAASPSTKNRCERRSGSAQSWRSECFGIHLQTDWPHLTVDLLVAISGRVASAVNAVSRRRRGPIGLTDTVADWRGRRPSNAR